MRKLRFFKTNEEEELRKKVQELISSLKKEWIEHEKSYLQAKTDAERIKQASEQKKIVRKMKALSGEIVSRELHRIALKQLAREKLRKPSRFFK